VEFLQVIRCLKLDIAICEYDHDKLILNFSWHFIRPYKVRICFNGPGWRMSI
jgi:hypothetical protein